MKNLVIALLLVAVIIMGCSLLWQGAIKQAVDANQLLLRITQELENVKQETEKRKQVWRLLYQQVGSGGEVKMKKFTNSDVDPASHPLIVETSDKRAIEFSPDGVTVKVK